jgi:outer membrane biosynthesis protein TonB
VEVSPAAIGSLALHGAVALALMISWGSRDLKVGSVVPVTIVSSAPDRDTRPAEQADTTQSAQSEEVAPEAPPEPVPPPPAPTPPSKATAQPAEKAPTPAPATPAPAKPAQKSLDLDSLYASLTKPARNAQASSAPKGATRAETAPAARQTVGSGLAAGAALQGLAEELQRRWNPNCEVEGGRDVVVKATFQLGVGGQVVGDVQTQIQGARTPVAQASADRAVRAVYAAAPFRGLPHEFYGERINVNFNAREACAR